MGRTNLVVRKDFAIASYVSRRYHTPGGHTITSKADLSLGLPLLVLLLLQLPLSLLALSSPAALRLLSTMAESSLPMFIIIVITQSSIPCLPVDMLYGRSAWVIHSRYLLSDFESSAANRRSGGSPRPHDHERLSRTKLRLGASEQHI